MSGCGRYARIRQSSPLSLFSRFQRGFVITNRRLGFRSERRSSYAVAVVAWLALLYGVSWHLIGGSSDNAAPVLAGRAMVHGNVFLHGWHLPADSYWLLDLPLLGLQSRLDSVNFIPRRATAFGTPDRVNVGCSPGYAARQSGLRSTTIAVGSTFLIVGLPSSLFGAFFLQGPLHVAPTLCCLVAFQVAHTGTEPPEQVGGSVTPPRRDVGGRVRALIGVVPVVVAGVAAGHRATSARRGWRCWSPQGYWRPSAAKDSPARSPRSEASDVSPPFRSPLRHDGFPTFVSPRTTSSTRSVSGCSRVGRRSRGRSGCSRRRPARGSDRNMR